MGVHNNILHIIIFEEIVPDISIEVEGVVEDEEEVWVRMSHHGSHSFVEFLESWEVRAPPWLVDWLKSIEGWMITPLLEESPDGINGPVHVVVVNEVVA